MGLVFPYLRTSEMFELLADPVLIMADYSRAQVLRLGKLNKLSITIQIRSPRSLLVLVTWRQCCLDPGCLSRILIFTHPGSRIQKQP
jgi:hypothetical protein